MKSIMSRKTTSVSAEERQNVRASDDCSDNECDHSSNDESSSVDFSDSDSDSQESFPEETLFQHAARSVVRRRAVSPLDSSDHRDDETTRARHEAAASRNTQRNNRGRGRQEPNFFQECFMFYADACPVLCNRRVNMTLLVCFLLWFGVQFHDAWTLLQRDPMDAVRKHYSADVRNRLRNKDVGPATARDQGRKGMEKVIPRGFWGGAQAKLEQLMPNSKPRKRKSRKEDALSKGCVRPEWQKLSFPNCNQIHELNLQEQLGLRRRGARAPERTNSSESFGYVGSGLWRTVWKIRGHDNMPLVIKMMKGEHDVDSRNFDRHRRDALSMERLTASPNIVSIYGHCGNTVLTEYLPRGLDTIVYNNGDKKQTETVATRQTPLGRLHLALHVARGVAAIHDLPGGPIIHADIQAKQFLVDSHGVVKLNDFNRCTSCVSSVCRRPL
jgi:hypothetical protein